MAKVQQFKNNPSPYSFGQYYYENTDASFQTLEESDSIKKPFDKYSEKSLHSVVTSDETRDYIVQHKLRHIGASGIIINKLKVKDTGTSYTHIDTDFRGFICDKNTFDCFHSDGELKEYRTIDDFFRKTSENNNNKETCQFFRFQPSDISNGNTPDFEFLSGKTIINNFAPDSFQVDDGDYLTQEQRDIRFGLDNFNASGSDNWDSTIPNSNFNPFHPKDDITTVEDRLTNIFSEDGQDNYIQIIIWLKSNQGGEVNKSRRRRTS